MKFKIPYFEKKPRQELAESETTNPMETPGALESPESNLEPETPESNREKLVKSLRDRFGQALRVVAASAAFVAAVTAPERIGYNKKDVADMLNKKYPRVSSYLEAASTAVNEGEMDVPERHVLAETVREGTVIESELGKYTLYNIGIKPSPESAKETCTVTINAKGLENIGIDLETIVSTLRNLPGQWQKNILAIYAYPKIEKMPKEYGINNVLGALAQYDPKSGRTIIIYFKQPESSPWRSFEVKKTLCHEAAHANDWAANNRNAYQRIRMLYKTLMRIKNNERFRSWYVESIKNPNTQQELFLKTQEYWAMIIQQYFSNKERLPQSDQQLVEEFK